MGLRPKVLLFGDSITQRSFQKDGWGAAMANRYFRMADVVCRGYSGYNTRWALHVLDQVFPIPTSDPLLLVTIFFGANDAVLPDRSSQSQHVPLAEYEKNLHKIISHVKTQSPATHIIIITPPPICEKNRQAFARLTYGDQAQDLPERTNEQAGLYAEACETVGKEAGIRVLNLWCIFQQTLNWQEKYLNDGLHFTPVGNIAMFEALERMLDEPTWVPSLKASELPWDFPEHSDIDPGNPAATFASWTRQPVLNHL